MSSYKLDADLDYFTFETGGNTYRMKYMNTKELEEFSKLPTEEQGTRILSLVKPESEGVPSIEEVAKTWTPPVWKKFRSMLKSEFGLEDNE